jgi:hypothetical protein
MSGEIYRTSGTISTYFATGSATVASAEEHPDSPFLDIGASDFKESWAKIPTEIIQKIREGEEAVRNYNKEIERRERATRIVNLIGTTNLIFQDKKGAKLFREDNPKIINELYTPCENEHDFIAKLAGLAALFEVELGPLRQLVEEAGNMRSISLIEKWLQENSIIHDPNMIETWKNIVTLRNMAPLHAQTRPEELMRALNFFGVPLPIDYSRLWNAILDKFSVSLEEWQRILQEL